MKIHRIERKIEYPSPYYHRSDTVQMSHHSGRKIHRKCPHSEVLQCICMRFIVCLSIHVIRYFLIKVNDINIIVFFNLL